MFHRSQVPPDEFSALGSLMNGRGLTRQMYGILRMFGKSCKQDLDGLKFQNIEELRAGIGEAYRRISENLKLRKDAHQLLKTYFCLLALPGLDPGPSQKYPEHKPRGY